MNTDKKSSQKSSSERTLISYVRSLMVKNYNYLYFVELEKSARTITSEFFLYNSERYIGIRWVENSFWSLSRGNFQILNSRRIVKHFPFFTSVGQCIFHHQAASIQSISGVAFKSFFKPSLVPASRIPRLPTFLRWNRAWHSHVATTKAW